MKNKMNNIIKIKRHSFRKMKKFLILIILLVTYIKLFLPYDNYNGIDISHHNEINWKDIAEDPNIEFCYIKASEGSNMKDSKCEEYAKAANQINLHIGLYHYFRTNKSANEQFANFRDVYNSVFSDLIPAIDVEDDGNIFDEQTNKTLKELINLFKEEYGVYPIVYYGSWNSAKTFPVTYKCKKWIRCLEYSNYLPNIITMKQTDVRNIGKNHVDLNYCSDIEELLFVNK